MRNTEIGTFRANSLDVEGAAIMLYFDFDEVTIDKFEPDAKTQGLIDTMIVRNSLIRNIAAEAFRYLWIQ